jgi:hypothetical protein
MNIHFEKSVILSLSKDQPPVDSRNSNLGFAFRSGCQLKAEPSSSPAESAQNGRENRA